MTLIELVAQIAIHRNRKGEKFWQDGWTCIVQDGDGTLKAEDTTAHRDTGRIASSEGPSIARPVSSTRWSHKWVDVGYAGHVWKDIQGFTEVPRVSAPMHLWNPVSEKFIHVKDWRTAVVTEDQLAAYLLMSHNRKLDGLETYKPAEPAPEKSLEVPDEWEGAPDWATHKYRGNLSGAVYWAEKPHAEGVRFKRNPDLRNPPGEGAFGKDVLLTLLAEREPGGAEAPEKSPEVPAGWSAAGAYAKAAADWKGVVFGSAARTFQADCSCCDATVDCSSPHWAMPKCGSCGRTYIGHELVKLAERGRWVDAQAPHRGGVTDTSGLAPGEIPAVLSPESHTNLAYKFGPAVSAPQQRKETVDSAGFPKQERYKDGAGEDWVDEFARTSTPEEFRGAMRFTVGKYNRRMGKKDEELKEVIKMQDYCGRWRQYLEAQKEKDDEPLE